MQTQAGMQKHSLTNMQWVVTALTSRGKIWKEINRVVTSSERKCYGCGEAGHLKVQYLSGRTPLDTTEVVLKELQKLLSGNFENI